MLLLALIVTICRCMCPPFSPSPTIQTEMQEITSIVVVCVFIPAAPLGIIVPAYNALSTVWVLYLVAVRVRVTITVPALDSLCSL